MPRRPPDTFRSLLAEARQALTPAHQDLMDRIAAALDRPQRSIPADTAPVPDPWLRGIEARRPKGCRELLP